MDLKEILDDIGLNLIEKHIEKTDNIKLKKNQIITKEKIEYICINNYKKFIVPKTHDIIFGCEIYAKNITRIDLSICGLLTTNYNIKNNGNIWQINCDDFFNGIDFLPLFYMKYCKIAFHIYGEEISDFYIIGALLEKDNKSIITKKGFVDVLTNTELQYNINMNFQNIHIKTPRTENQISYSNYINELRFKFDRDVDFENISIYVFYQDDYRLLKKIMKNDLIFISNSEFIMNNFNYKTFLFTNIILKFDKHIEGSLVLTTKNYNLIRIKYGLASMFLNLEKLEIKNYID